MLDAQYSVSNPVHCRFCNHKDKWYKTTYETPVRQTVRGSDSQECSLLPCGGDEADALSL